MSVVRKLAENTIWWQRKCADKDREIKRLREALERLVTLQAHYAKLLNMHDGGERHSFASAQEWLDRLDDLKLESEGGDGNSM